MISNSAILAQICEQCRLSPQDIQDVYPCTPLQSGMMVDSALYVHTIVRKIAASVDLDRLCGALDQVVATNDVLRTRIVDCDGPGLLQAVVRKWQPVLRTPEIDLQLFLERNSSAAMHLGMPLVRFALVCSGDDTRLITTMHHAMFDFHVLEFLMADVWSVYQGISLPERAPFKDFVQHCTSINPKEASTFWEKRFSGGASTFPTIPTGHQVLANEIMTRDINLSHDNKPAKALPSMALMPAYIEAAWAMTVSDYTNNDSVAFGYLLSGRGPGMPGGAETTFGPTITSVPVQVDLRRNMTIQQLVKGRVASRRELSTSHFLHYGLSRIRNINDDTHKVSSFQSALSIVHRSHTTALGTSGLSLDEAYTEEPPKPHGLLLICTPGEKQISVKTLFDPIVLAKEQVHRILRQLEHRLRQLVTSAPSTPLKRLDSLNFGDKLELMDWSSRRFPSAPIKTCIHTRIAARAADQPNDLAVKSWDGEATYAELITMVNNLAHEILIRHKALAAEEPVCIILGRSLSLVVALLAVMRAGGTCVPIDPNLPTARKEDIVRRSQARLTLTSPDTHLQEHDNNCITHPVVLDRRLDTSKAAELPIDNWSSVIQPIQPGISALDKIVAHHEMLRCRFSHAQDAGGNTTLSQRIVPLKDQSGDETTWAFRVHHNIASQKSLWDIVSSSQASLNIVQGPVFAADVIISAQGETSLFLVAHHLVIDIVSWRILWEDLEAVLQDDAVVLPRSFPFPLWVQSQNNMLISTPKSSLPSWPKASHHFWGMDGVTPKVRDMLRIQHTLDLEQTAQIMGESCNRPFNTTPVVLLLTALILSFRRSFPDRGIPALYCEGHGRETDATKQSVDTSRTIGWFTTVFPLPLHALETYDSVEYTIMAIKDEYQEASKQSIEQFALQVLGEQTPSSFKRSDIELAFNFAGRMQQVTRDDALLKLQTDGPPVHLENMAGDCEAASLLSIFASIGQDERLTLTLDYNSHMAHQDRIVHWIQEELGNCFTEMISTLPRMGCRLTASDLPLLNLGSGGPTSVAYLHAHLAELGVAQDNVQSIYPCTATQEGILFAQLNGHDYHNRFVARLSLGEGAVDIDRVAQAWKAACRAHDILRTIFTTGLSDQGAFQQIVLKRSEPSISFKEMPTDGSTVSQVAASQQKIPLDPKKPPHHLTLYRESASIVHAILDVSHTLADAKTFQGLWKTIGEVYTRMGSDGRATVAPGRPFSDYVIWLQSQQEESHMHWRDYLQGTRPCVFPQEPTATVGYVAQGPFVPFNNAQRLHRFCQDQGVTNAMFMQAAWALVLRKYTDKSTVCFGSVRSDQEVLPSSGGRAEIIGPLISMLPCKFHLENPAALTTMDILETARNAASTAMRYSGCYLAELHDELGLRDSPLFDTVMTIQRAWSTDLGDGAEGLAIKITDVDGPSEFSIVVAVQYSENGLLIRLSHQRGHVSDSLIGDIAETFARVIEYMIQSTDQPLVNILKSCPTPDLDLLKQWNADPPTAAVDQSIPSAFRAHAHLQGSAPAVCSWDADLSYSELGRLSDRLAYRLRVKHGVRADMIVPFCCIKATSAIVIMLAIWKAGAALLPLDFSHPSERLSAILEETEAKLVLVNASERVDKMTSCLPRGTVDLVDLTVLEQDDKPDDEIRLELTSYTIEPQHAGYVVYTSGSTGRPKGLILDHRSIVTSSMHMTPLLGLTSQSRILQLTNFVFDFGLLDVMFAFFTGACICMPSQDEATNDVGGAIRRTEANFVECTPTYASLFNPHDAPSLQTVVLAGEPMKQENLETWASHARIMNAYGPGETGMSSCGDVVIGQDGTFSQDIGQPFGCRYWVVDPDNSDELVPIGTTGELVIEGPIVGRGYVNNPEATASAFIDAPAWTQHAEFASLNLGEHRFYKSGDLVTQRSKASFIFEGRKDYQVKIRGQRIEMGEIEHHLSQQTLGVSKWAVEVIQRGTSQEVSLAAFCQVSSEDALPPGSNVLPPLPQTAETAREALRHAVPSYMVPEFFIPLHKLPTTGSMKTDRKALRTMANRLSGAELMSYRVIGRQKAEDDHEQSSSTAVLTGLESFLQRTWADLLNVPVKSIQPSDDFFALGGNSIRAMRLAGALRKSGYLLSVADVFRSPTIARMALKTCPLPSGPNGSTPKPIDILQPHDIPRLSALAKTRGWLETSNIEGIAPATDLQALMLCEEYLPDRGSNVATVTVELLARQEQQSLDLVRLQEACEQAIHHHPILRTVFIQNERSLLQLTLRNTPVKQIHVLQPGETSNQRVSPSSNILDILPRFDLISNDSGSKCSGFTLTIHHAHYDAISMGHLLDDLKNTYNGMKVFSRQPSFHEWSSYGANAERLAESQGFWHKLLKDSMSYPLAPSGSVRQQSYNPGAQQYHTSIQVPVANLESSNGTMATVLKAAWSCLLSQVLEKQDIVFSFLSANRFSNTLPHGSAEQVPGPCINLVPVRASMGDGDKTMATLVRELQEQSNESLPHQHTGFRSIVKNCTRWPTSRFNSAILFQNHGEFEHSLRLGNVACTVAGIGQGTNSADVWITATPRVDHAISIELRFALDKVPMELCRWISSCLESLLNILPRWWERGIYGVHDELMCMVGPNPLSPVPNKSCIPRPGGAEPEDVVDEVLQAGHFECAC
ncbi:nonribosomal peptide synthase [Fusarium albosuccineum]|uniref:Nonribosomal peptide synthase n=1 Tax=Fusarium albosuccineum TaxID=1237068 RepID=A0A8H4L719_9HYPO|nr:nonribosomal peptide synthase [Fusarium albosuccineum]